MGKQVRPRRETCDQSLGCQQVLSLPLLCFLNHSHNPSNSPTTTQTSAITVRISVWMDVATNVPMLPIKRIVQMPVAQFMRRMAREPEPGLAPDAAEAMRRVSCHPQSASCQSGHWSQPQIKIIRTDKDT